MTDQLEEQGPWKEWPEMHDTREMHSSLTMPHQVFVFCGHDGERFLNTIEVLDLAFRQAPFRRKYKPNWDIVESELLTPR